MILSVIAVLKQAVIDRAALLCSLLLFMMGVSAQTPETFTIATLNVDGLPQKLLVINVNSDGPGSTGSVRISQYLAKKNYDLVFMQEDFNYNDELTVLLEDNYLFDIWSGDVALEGHSIDYLHLQNHRFDCDGLMAAWKKGITVVPTGRGMWTDYFGKFSHANDEMVTKGFRRYEIILATGTEIVVYNMHMDAEDDPDTMSGKAVPDRKAREGEWQQLRDDILNTLDDRPVVIVGDMNSFYFRDRVKELFVDAITATGKATVIDSWIALQNAGQYPAYQEDSRISDDDEEQHGGETLDKIICINPVGGQQLRPLTYSRDKEGYLRDGKPLGDHYPVAVTFEVVGKTTGVNEMEGVSGTKDDVYFDLRGRRVQQPTKGLYIERHQEKVRKIIVK